MMDTLTRRESGETRTYAREIRARTDLSDLLAREVDRRAFRTTLFGRRFASGCGWDVLSDLYMSAASSQGVMVCSVALDSDQPRSTVARYVRLLIEEGLIVPSDDPSDRRRCWLHLSRRGLDLMNRYLASPRA